MLSLHPSSLPHATAWPRCCVVKLGGGLITGFSACGNAVPVLNRALLVALAGELRALHCPLIVLHGTGTFGKPPALKYGYMDGRLACERRAVVAEVASQLAQMEADVLACLLEGGLHAFRLPVVGLAPRAGASVGTAGAALVGDLLARGMTPVIGGNFALDEDGFAVYSSDNIAVDLAIAMQAQSLVLATRAHGVYSDFGRSNSIYTHLCEGDVALIDSVDAADHDVSGGMRRKIVTGMRAAQHGIPTYIVDGRIPGNVAQALSGSPMSGTQLHAGAALAAG